MTRLVLNSRDLIIFYVDFKVIKSCLDWYIFVIEVFEKIKRVTIQDKYESKIKNVFHIDQVFSFQVIHDHYDVWN